MKILSTLKRVRVRKREKPLKASQAKEKRRRIGSTVDNFDIKETGQVESDRYVVESGRYASIEEKNDLPEIKETDETEDAKEEDKKSGVSLIFEHELTEFEFKLRYLNLKDVAGKEYGRLFPPIRSQLVIIDAEGRKFSATRVGNNQISGDLFSFFNVNKFKPGDLISFEYDREERSEDGDSVIHIKPKKK